MVKMCIFNEADGKGSFSQSYVGTCQLVRKVWPSLLSGP